MKILRFAFLVVPPKCLDRFIWWHLKWDAARRVKNGIGR